MHRQQHIIGWSERVLPLPHHRSRNTSEYNAVNGSKADRRYTLHTRRLSVIMASAALLLAVNILAIVLGSGQ